MLAHAPCTTNPRSTAAKGFTQIRAKLHQLKIWLNAPIAIRRHAIPKSGDTKQGHTATANTSVAALVLRVSWFAILLGLTIQVLLLIVSTLLGHTPKLNPLITDVAQRITWSTIVCGSISIATVASKLDVSFMGLAGMLSASLAFKVARAVQKGVGAALGLPPAIGPSPLVLGIIKAVEYGCLAALLSWMVKRKNAGAMAHAAIGLVMGTVFGGIVLSYTYWVSPKLYTAADVLSRGLNELLFPVGCSLVLFVTDVWSKHWKTATSSAVTVAAHD